ncbi:FAS1-like dehydratase domain-containing protein [Gordonia sp. (in: high G+C Gram-positive bacteria)]|uniref:FAS1-like dehydratase domain-containing protein n=1 Tax=Gordonia sp. (in: high G+C Gram-positive bacteria) TaxID=84139 RepID=UPI003F9B9EC5
MSWAPHTVVTDELIDPAPLAALAALFDDWLEAPAPGDELPPLWHWAALGRWASSSELSIDGHPFRGSFLPPVELPRRMFAGGRVEFVRPLRVGDVTRRTSRVDEVTEKNGRSGRLVLVTVTTVLHDTADRPAVIERQDLIYRDAAVASGQPAEPTELTPAGPPLRKSGDGWTFHTDPTLLMRFSAATANAHRIHYDWPYATRVEGYPGLVVHGPLMSLAVAQTRRLSDGSPISAIEHRNGVPLFCGQDAEVVVDESTRTLVGADGRPRTTVTFATG